MSRYEALKRERTAVGGEAGPAFAALLVYRCAFRPNRARTGGYGAIRLQLICGVARPRLSGESGSASPHSVRARLIPGMDRPDSSLQSTRTPCHPPQYRPSV